MMKTIKETLEHCRHMHDELRKLPYECDINKYIDAVNDLVKEYESLSVKYAIQEHVLRQTEYEVERFSRGFEKELNKNRTREQKLVEIKQRLSKIIEKYGNSAQILQNIEEMSELTKELLKNINRGEENIKEIEKEVADVIITTLQVIMIYDFKSDELEKIINNKLDRQEKRMKK